MKVFYNGELVEASMLRDTPGGPITYQIGNEFVGASQVVIPSDDIQAGKVPPTPFSETGEDLEKVLAAQAQTKKGK